MLPAEIFLLGILIFKGLTEGRLYKSFGVKGVKQMGFLLLSCYNTRSLKGKTIKINKILKMHWNCCFLHACTS
jgi:hypothetical protein